MTGIRALDEGKIDSRWGLTSLMQVAMLKSVLNEDELDEWYAD